MINLQEIKNKVLRSENTMRSLFEHRWYLLQADDYLVPNLTLPKSAENNISIYRQQHLEYLQKYHRLTYINLLTNGMPSEYLSEIDKQTRECFGLIIKQIKIAQGYHGTVKS